MINRSVMALILSWLLFGCAAPYEPQIIGVDFMGDKISNGMSLDKVEEIYGKPYRHEMSASITGEKNLVQHYIYQGPIGNGKFIRKEIIVVFSNNVVIKHHYSEKTLLRLEKDSKASNDVIQLN
jgi:hypothetical protein